MLDTHRGYDMGALAMARELAAAFAAPLIAGTVSRLLVDLNRSPGHPRLHGEALRRVPADVRARIVERYYAPYRTNTGRCVHQAVTAGHRVVHISSHSFTPKLDGKVRNADIGLLYDPARRGEVDLSGRWKACLETCAPALVIRRNYPYAGKGDGLTSYLRHCYPPGAYVGVELEINQKHSSHSAGTLAGAAHGGDRIAAPRAWHATEVFVASAFLRIYTMRGFPLVVTLRSCSPTSWTPAALTGAASQFWQPPGRRHATRSWPRLGGVRLLENFRGAPSAQEMSMKIRIGCELTYQCPQPVPMMLAVHVHPSRREDLVVEDWLVTELYVPVRIYPDGFFGNLCTRLIAPTGQFRLLADGVVVDDGQPDRVVPDGAAGARR